MPVPVGELQIKQSLTVERHRLQSCKMPDDAPMQTRVVTHTTPRILHTLQQQPKARLLQSLFDWLFTGVHEIKVTL